MATQDTMELDWERHILPFYQLSFNILNKMGILPYALVTNDERQLELIPINLSGFTLFHFNICFVILHFMKAIILRSLNELTEFEFEGFKGGRNIQFLWNLGFIWMVAILHSMVWDKEKVSGTLTACIRLEKLLVQDLQTPNNKTGLKKRHLFLKFQQYCGIIFYLSGCLVVFFLVTFFPDFPSFLYSILPCSYDIHVPCTTGNTIEDLGYYALRILLTLFEFYSFSLVCGIMGASTFIFGLVYRATSNGLESLRKLSLDQLTDNKRLNSRMETVNLAYKSLQILSDRLSSTFSGSLLAQEATILLTITYVLFVALTLDAASVIIKLFFYYISVVLCFVITFQFFPMVKVYLVSKKLLPYLRSMSAAKSAHKKLVLSFRVLAIRPAKVHTITLFTFCDYTVFIISFVILLLQIESSKK